MQTMPNEEKTRGTSGEETSAGGRAPQPCGSDNDSCVVRVRNDGGTRVADKNKQHVFFPPDAKDPSNQRA